MQATLQDYSRSATSSIRYQQSMEPQENLIHMLEAQTVLIILHTQAKSISSSQNEGYSPFAQS